MKAETLSISTQDVTELLNKCILETTRCSLRDIAEKSKQCMEEALKEIRASVHSGIKEFTEAATKGAKRKLKLAHSDKVTVKKVKKTSATSMTKVKASAKVTQHNPVLFIPSTSGCMTEEQYNILKDSKFEPLTSYIPWPFLEFPWILQDYMPLLVKQNW